MLLLKGPTQWDLISIAQNGTLLAYTTPSETLQNSSFNYGSTFNNVTLVAGSNAQIWAGIRGGYFAALSASSSLTWQDSPAVDAAPVVEVLPPAPVAQSQAAQASTTVAMPRYGP